MKNILKSISFFILFFVPFNCFALDYPYLDSKAVVVYDKSDDKLLYSYNNEEIKSIASLTKIVTTIVSIEKISNLDDEVIITSDIINSVDPVASKAGLRVGDVVTYRDLLYASILPSGADATNALAISLSGSIDDFVNDMNAFANRLELENTHFVNVTGLDDDNHYSTANDILKILSYSLDNELFYNVFTTKQYFLKNGLEVKSTLYKYNGDDINQIIGSKTGFTGNAGYCIATLSKTDGHDIITILLDAEHRDGLYFNIVDSVNLINFINENYSNVLLLKKNDVLITLPVNLCDIDEYTIYSLENVYKFLPSDYDKSLFKYEYKGLNFLDYKNKKNDKIGVINYYYADEIIYKEDVFLKNNLDISYFKIIKKYIVYELCFFCLFILTIIFIIFSKKKKIKGVSYEN